jgi:hypothetical protein
VGVEAAVAEGAEVVVAQTLVAEAVATWEAVVGAKAAWLAVVDRMAIGEVELTRWAEMDRTAWGTNHICAAVLTLPNMT